MHIQPPSQPWRVELEPKYGKVSHCLTRMVHNLGLKPSVLSDQLGPLEGLPKETLVKDMVSNIKLRFQEDVLKEMTLIQGYL